MYFIAFILFSSVYYFQQINFTYGILLDPAPRLSEWAREMMYGCCNASFYRRK